MALPLISLIWGISTQWLVLLEAAEKQRARSRGTCRARSIFSSEALSGVFQAAWAVSPFLGDSLPCPSLEPGRGREAHREDGSGIGVSPFEGRGSFLTRCGCGGEPASGRLSSCEVGAAGCWISKSPPEPPVLRSCKNLRTPPVGTWPSLSPALLWVPFRLYNLSLLLFPSLGLAASLPPDHRSHPSPPRRSPTHSGDWEPLRQDRGPVDWVEGRVC